MKKKDYVAFTSTGEILKADDEEHFVLSPVLIPYKEDKQGDTITPEEIEKTAHKFMEDYQLVGEMHARIVGKKDAPIVESYILRDDQVINGRAIPQGTWMIGLKVYDARLWEAIKNGKYKGVSIGGFCHACKSKSKTKKDDDKKKEGQILQDLEVEEVSIVDEPAVPDAKWIIVKGQGGVKLPEEKTEKQDLKAKVEEIIGEIKTAVENMDKTAKDDPAQAIKDMKAEMEKVIAELEIVAGGEYGYAYPAPKEEESEDEKPEEKKSEDERTPVEELVDAIRELLKTKEDKTPDIKEEIEKSVKEMIPDLKTEIVKEVRKTLKPKVDKKEIPKEEKDEEKRENPKTLREAVEMMIKR